jgi:hypothetical protein
LTAAAPGLSNRLNVYRIPNPVDDEGAEEDDEGPYKFTFDQFGKTFPQFRKFLLPKATQLQPYRLLVEADLFQH